MSVSGDYSEVAAAQLDELESSASDALWDAVLDARDLALNHPSHARKYSAAITTSEGAIVFRLAVVGHAPHQVFWSLRDGRPRIEAVFPHP